MMPNNKYHDIPNATAVVNDPTYYGGDKKSTQYGSGMVDAQVKGEMQPPAFRDAFFGLLFWAHIVTVVTFTVMYLTGRIPVDFEGMETGGMRRNLMESGRILKSSTRGDEVTSMAPLAMSLLTTVIAAPALTIGLFSFMYNNGVQLIQFSIYMAIGINSILTVVLLFSGAILGAIGAGLGVFFLWMYARFVWDRIPLAAVNLKTAVASIQPQLGVAFLGLANVPVYLVWWALWMYFFVCTLNTPFMQSQVESTKVVHSSGYKGDGDYVNTVEESRSGLWYFIFFLMLLSFYWTNQVIKNTIQTTVAGTVGTFWFVPEEAMGCCSPAFSSSLFRSLTYSFGSICFGSLIVAIIETLRAMARQARESARNNQDGGGALILCLVECLLGILESIAEYFNKWAFIYVGLYGYSYLEAGKNVLTLFRERGWNSMITDDLTSRVLGMMSFAIGLGVGLIAALVAALTAMFSSGGSVGAMIGGSLILGIFLGMAMASTVLNVLYSAANTIIVLFAEAPAEFQENHPQLSMEMNQAWSSAYGQLFTPTNPTMDV